jgi:hypothetical protein
MLRGNCYILPTFSTEFESLNSNRSKTAACTHLKNGPKRVKAKCCQNLKKITVTQTLGTG